MFYIVRRVSFRRRLTAFNIDVNAQFVLTQDALVALLCYSIRDKQSNNLPKERFTQFREYNLHSSRS